MEPAETIHIEANKIHFNYHIFLLFIPAIVFAIVLAFVFGASRRAQVAQTEGIQVLGTDSQ